MVQKSILGLVGIFVVAFVLFGSIFIFLSPKSVNVQEELDFSISGSNDCLRFLSRTVETIYIPINIEPNEFWELTIECTDIAAPNGWVDLYIYDGYWNGGVENKCLSEDIYSILDGVVSLDYELGKNNPYSQVFGGASHESHTIFFIFPPGGSSTFHVTLIQKI